MSAEYRVNSKISAQDEKDAWDSYASAALNALIVKGGGASNPALLAADYATMLLDERRKAFPDKERSASSKPLSI
jgi:hypothetical protein